MLDVRSVCGTVTAEVLATAGGIVWTAVLVFAQQPAPGPVPPILQNYKTVTAECLKKPEDGDWLMVRRTYDGWGYSPLDQITPGNVARLQPVWIFATGMTSGHEAAPIVNNGVMFVATPGNQVIALDARTGGLLWRYRRPLPEDLLQPHRTSRGVALSGDKVFFAAAEAVLVALDARTGTGKRVEVRPSLWGGKNWPPIAFSPKTRMIYIPANENLCMTFGGRGGLSIVPGADHIGEVQAWNVDTGQRVWTHTYGSSENWGPMPATSGGVVFSGGTNDRKFHAFDAANGRLLWEYPTNSGITSQPTSFSIGGRQYIAVQSGWGVDARGMQGALNAARPGEFPEVPEGGAVWVFAVK